jgi:hypothetical protein
MQAFRATIDAQGQVHFADAVSLGSTRQALVIFMDEGSDAAVQAQFALVGELLKPELPTDARMYSRGSDCRYDPLF